MSANHLGGVLMLIYGHILNSFVIEKWWLYYPGLFVASPLLGDGLAHADAQLPPEDLRARRQDLGMRLDALALHHKRHVPLARRGAQKAKTRGVAFWRKKQQFCRRLFFFSLFCTSSLLVTRLSLLGNESSFW